MKIGILTFHCAINYGAVMQAYALQKYLESIGHEVYVIDYRPEYLTKPYSLAGHEEKPEGIKAQVRWFVRKFILLPVRLRRKILFSRFIRRNFNLIAPDALEHIEIDAFICGSDQIWNPNITNGFDPLFIGTHELFFGHKVISYAASAGCNKNIEEYKNNGIFFSALKSFSSVSVREESLFQYCQKNNIQSTVVADPTILAGITLFRKISLPAGERRPFLLLFQVNRNDIIAEYAYRLAKEKNLELVEIAPCFESFFNRNMRQTVSPERFLGYFQEASYVITSSYHGTLFSILFHKNFMTVKVSESTDRRAQDILSKFGLMDRMVNPGDPIIDKDIDYGRTEMLMAEFRSTSCQFISQALEK